MDAYETAPQVDVIIPCYQLLAFNKHHFEDLVSSLCTPENRVYIHRIIVINDDPQEDIASFIELVCNEKNIYAKVQLVQNTHCLGQGAARNLGASYAKASYLHFIDQDDFITKDFYQQVLFPKVDCGLASLVVYDHGQLRKHHRLWTDWWYKRASKVADLSFFMFANLAVSPGQYVIKKTIYEEIGGFPDLKNKGSDDFGFLFQLCESNATFSFADKAIFYHRLHENQGKKQLNITLSVKEFLNTIAKPKRFFLRINHQLRQYVFFEQVLSKICYKLFFS
ncbi:MAG: glycosyltransferase family 2 protein [Spirosomataceae bacterium]